MRPLARERSRLFDQEAQRYDRSRPSYPAAAIDAVLGEAPSGLEVLDVGCGTGIASRLMAARGAKVLGVEPAERMAAIARGHGIDVEVASFEAWKSCGRTFDRVTSAQAWHWLDPAIASSKAASLLRPGGRLCLMWNAGYHADDLAAALGGVYLEVLPDLETRPFVGYAANSRSDARSEMHRTIDAINEVPEFDAVTRSFYSWPRRYGRDEWIDQQLSLSDHAALPLDLRNRLCDQAAEIIDQFGGSFIVQFETVVLSATRRGRSDHLSE